jgi:hypothetical protein
MFQKIEVEINIPDGYEATGEFRYPVNGELYLYCGTVAKSDGVHPERLILRKVKRYREPTLPADYGKECEFSNSDGEWSKGVLIGYRKNDCQDLIPWSGGEDYYCHCRIACDE